MEKKIDLMIIGAQKAGTTSLNHYLAQHPKIYTHSTIEFGMFADIEAYEKGLEYYYKNTIPEVYRKNPAKTILVAKRVGLMNNPLLINKLKEHNTNIKVVVVLRNPIERAFSAFNYCRNSGMEPYSNFNDAVFINDPARFNGNERIKKNCEYISRSSYLHHLKNVYSILTAENIRVFLFEEMILDLNRYLNEMVNFIGLENYEFDISKKYNEGKISKSSLVSRLLSPGKLKIFKDLIPIQQRTKLKNILKQANSNQIESRKRTMDIETKAYLKNIFKQDINELENFTNLPLKKYWPEFFDEKVIY